MSKSSNQIIATIENLMSQLSELKHLRLTNFSAYSTKMVKLSAEQATVFSTISEFSKTVLDAKLECIAYSGLISWIRPFRYKNSLAKHNFLKDQLETIEQAYTRYQEKLSDATGLPVPESWLASKPANWDALYVELKELMTEAQRIKAASIKGVDPIAFASISAKRYEIFKQAINGRRALTDIKVHNIEKGIANNPEYIRADSKAVEVEKALETLATLLVR